MLRGAAPSDYSSNTKTSRLSFDKLERLEEQMPSIDL